MAARNVPKKTYVIVWACLMVLTVVTAAVSKVDLGRGSAAVALIIATSKGLLVALFFMGVKYISEKMTVVVIVAGLFWLGILLTLSMTDYATRAFR